MPPSMKELHEIVHADVLLQIL